jgi:hypothetical protein
MSPPPDIQPHQAIPPASTADPNPDPIPAPAAPSSILAFLGGQPRSSPLVLNPNTAKRRKKNDETPINPAVQSHTQARIVLKPANGAAWTVEKKEVKQKDEVAGEVTGKGKGKGKVKQGGGEEDEMKDMGKRAKAAQRGRGGKRPAAGKRKAGKKEAGQLDLKASQDDGESPI